MFGASIFEINKAYRELRYSKTPENVARFLTKYPGSKYENELREFYHRYMSSTLDSIASEMKFGGSRSLNEMKTFINTVIDTDLKNKAVKIYNNALWNTVVDKKTVSSIDTFKMKYYPEENDEYIEKIKAFTDDINLYKEALEQNSIESLNEYLETSQLKLFKEEIPQLVKKIKFRQSDDFKNVYNKETEKFWNSKFLVRDGVIEGNDTLQEVFLSYPLAKGYDSDR